MRFVKTNVAHLSLPHHHTHTHTHRINMALENVDVARGLMDIYADTLDDGYNNDVVDAHTHKQAQAHTK